MICKKMNGHENFPQFSKRHPLGRDRLIGYSCPIPQRDLSAFAQIESMNLVGRKAFTSTNTVTEAWLKRPIWRPDWAFEVER
jgi:hypothetical protein